MLCDWSNPVHNTDMMCWGLWFILWTVNFLVLGFHNVVNLRILICDLFPFPPKGQTKWFIFSSLCYFTDIKLM